jgi:hypothetical protein
MADRSQARAATAASETAEISVDLNEPDPDKAVERRQSVASQVRDNQEGAQGEKPYSRADRELFKRMSRFQRNIQKSFDQKLADQQARHQQEIADLRKSYETIKVERGGDEAAASAHETKMKELTEKLAAANERGDSAEAARITAEMIKADGAYHAKISGASQRRDTSGDDRTSSTTTTTARQSAGPTAAGSRFILANEEWWHDPEYQIEKDAASKFYIQLIQDEGYDANDDETFREVAKRLKSKFPALEVQTRRGRAADPDEDLEDDEEGDNRSRRRDADDERPRPPPRRAAAANFQDRGGDGGRAQRATLDAKDIKTMRDANMDPDNNGHVLAFLREKQNYERVSR